MNEIQIQKRNRIVEKKDAGESRISDEIISSLF